MLATPPETRHSGHSRANTFANVILAGTLLCCLLVFLYSISRIVSIYAGRSPALYRHQMYYVYFGVSVVGIGLCVLVFKLSQSLKINCVLAGLSTVFGIYLIECGLLIFTGEKLVEPGVIYDTRTKIQVIAEFLQQGVDAYPAILPCDFIDSNGIQGNENPSLFPVGGISQKTIVVCNEGGEYGIYESDEHGFNNPYGVFSHNNLDLVLIGDSYTNGYCVKAGEDIGSVLRRTGKTVLNLGMGGNGPLLELAALKEYAEPLKPKIVLWMYYEANDISIDLEDEKTSPLLVRYLDEDFSQGLLDKQEEIDRALGAYVGRRAVALRNGQPWREKYARVFRILTHVIKLWHLRSRLGIAPFPSPPPSPSQLAMFARILEKARTITSSWGGAFYVVYLPALERYSRRVQHGSFMGRDQVLSLVRRLNIPIIDIHETFMKHPDPVSLFPFRAREHYTKEGYRLVAQTISAHLNLNTQ